jgi:hypothetical protein
MNRPRDNDPHFRRPMHRPRTLRIRNGVVEHMLHFAWLDGATDNDITLDVQSIKPS